MKSIGRIPVEVVLAHQMAIANDHDALQIMMLVLLHSGVDRIQRRRIHPVVARLLSSPTYAAAGLGPVRRGVLRLGRRQNTQAHQTRSNHKKSANPHVPNHKECRALRQTQMHRPKNDLFISEVHTLPNNRKSVTLSLTSSVREATLLAKLLMLISAAITFTLGAMHLLYTFSGTLLTPRDPALQIAMTQIAPVITKQTTMWRCWIG